MISISPIYLYLLRPKMLYYHLQLKSNKFYMLEKFFHLSLIIKYLHKQYFPLELSKTN